MSESVTSEQLRDALFSLILDQENDRLGTVCSAYAAQIEEFFGEWTQVPAELRAHPQAVQAYGHCLITLARLFEANGIPTLMERLTGGADNPITRWRNLFAKAQALAREGDYEASSALLNDLLPELKGAQGSAVDDYRTKVWGLLGSNAFYLGRRSEALELTTRALEDCRRCGDAAGVRAYTENLQVLSAAAAAESDDAASVRLCRIRAALARAQRLSDDARYDQSNDLLESVLADIEAGDGPGCEYRGKALGLRGLNCFRLGDIAGARLHTASALAACQSRADGDGERVYALNLARIDKEGDGDDKFIAATTDAGTALQRPHDQSG